MKTEPISRRTAIQYIATAAGSAALPRFAQAEMSATRKPLLGLDGHSMRGMKWKAMQHIQYASELKLDAVLFNGFQYFKSLDADHLKRVKEFADSNGIRIYTGAGSVSIGSHTYRDKSVDPESNLVKGIGVASMVGSPVVNCRIGSIKDRYSEGGIEARIAEAVKTLKAVRSRAEDAGVKFAFENHAGDTRSEEVLALINEVGTDICGVMLDPGNALWAMEDPMGQLRKLGSHVLCMSVRDYMVWESEEGATFQWTAIGEGLMDVPAYTRLLQEKCPQVPIFVESISNSARPIPFLKAEHWAGFANLAAADIVEFLTLLRRGHALEIVSAPAGVDPKEFERELQRSEFEKSIRYLRNLES